MSEVRGPGDLLRLNAVRDPSRPALVDADDRLDRAALDRAVTSAARALIAAGLAPGDRVALQLATGLDFVTLYLGALRAGLVAVPVNPAYTAAEVAHIVADSRATLHLDTHSARELLAAAPQGGDPHLDRDAGDLAALLYTSGTSGRAKGAMLSARALLANLDQLASVDPPLLTCDDVLFVPLPLTHIFGLNAGLGMALRTGATLVLAARFDPDETLSIMIREGVTAVLGVPGQYAAWLNRPAMPEAFAPVRFAMSGSTTLARGVLDGFAAAGVVLHDGYGLTEAAPVVTVNALGAGREHPTPGSIGRPLPGVEVELRDVGDSRELADEDDPGRIFVRGDNLFSGYWPDGNGGPDADGWFGTGDIAVADVAGELHLVGRSTELVIVNGFNVYPAEVEAVFAEHPAVAEVAVVGVRIPDDPAGEQLRAYVVPAAAASATADELLAHASGALARFKLPSVIELVEHLPHTVTGKIMKWQVTGAGS
jgi:long-chain acyl-CoA synthetase